MNQPILQLKNLGLNLDGQQILEAIDFTVNQGEFVTITGPSGSGKSSLLKLVGSLNQPTEGTIFFEGKDLYDYEMTEYRKQVSYFFQNAVLFGETVRDNLAFPYKIRGLEFDQAKAESMLATVQLPKSIIDKSISSISGGEKQRIALVRNLLFQPKVLLLDEITSSLDKENREIVLKLLGDLQTEEQITILMVTHNEDEIENASRKIQIIDGRMSDDGTNTRN